MNSDLMVDFYFSKAVGFSEKGPRPVNQDAVYPPLGKYQTNGYSRLYMVCDGVGGGAAGEVAANLVCDVIAAGLSTKERISNLDIQTAVLEAQKAIRDYLLAHPEAYGMATTLAMVFCNGQGVWQIHMGDSKIYQFRDGKVISVSRSHSIVEEMVSGGLITESEARIHPKRNVITRAITGRESDNGPEISYLDDIRHGDFFLLCSDGLWEGYSDSQLASLIGSSEKDMEGRLSRLKMKWTPKARDNFSAYLIFVSKKDWGEEKFSRNSGINLMDTLIIFFIVLSLLFVLYLIYFI